MRMEEPSWLTIPERGLYTALLVVGAIGSLSAGSTDFAEGRGRPGSSPVRRGVKAYLGIVSQYPFNPVMIISFTP